MTIKELLKANHDIEIELLLAYVLKQTKEFLYLNSSYNFTTKELAKVNSLIKKRRKDWPVAYLVGSKEFFGYKFKVNRHTLIPRPESEWLVEESLRVINKKLKTSKNKNLKVVDIGTGSGCLIISVCKALLNRENLVNQAEQVNQSIDFYGRDLSDKALAVAKNNAKAQKVNIFFERGDLLSNTKSKFDCIIANLPYVPVSDYAKFFTNLKYEPKIALTDGTNEFLLIKKFLRQAVAKLKLDGVVLLETDPASILILRQTIEKLFPKKKITIIKDIHKLERFIKIF